MIPTQATTAPSEGRVIAVGPDVPDLTPGDTIIFTDYAGIELPKANTNDPTFILMAESDAIATITEV